MQTSRAFSRQDYQHAGYCGPIPLLPRAQADRYRRGFFEVIGQSEETAGPTSVDMSAWHVKVPWAYELATCPDIADCVAAVLGPNIVLWAMHFWYKEPGNGTFVPWHQDIDFWPMDPPLNMTAWVALGPTSEANGCLQLIPGTHEAAIPHVELNQPGSVFGKGISENMFDETEVVSLEMAPGDICFFNEHTAHGSRANTSTIPRVALSLRFTTPATTFDADGFGDDLSMIRLFVVRGQDTHHLNDALYGRPPRGVPVDRGAV